VQYQPQTNGRGCLPKTTCTPGQFVADPGTSSTDRTCAVCNGQFGYTDVNNLPTCKPTANCTAGTYIAAQSTPTSNRVCQSCAQSQSHPGCEPSCNIGFYFSAVATASSD
jgi:hypothetical protein